MQRKPNEPSVDVVQIVQQVRKTIEKREARMDNAGTTRERVRDRMIHRITRASMPEDVKRDLIEARMEWVFDPETFWWSRRPVLGSFLNLLRRLARPLVKLFFNPDALLHHVNRLSYLVMYQQQLLEDLMVELEFAREGREKEEERKSSGRRHYRRNRRRSGSRNPRGGSGANRNG